MSRGRADPRPGACQAPPRGGPVGRLAIPALLALVALFLLTACGVTTPHPLRPAPRSPAAPQRQHPEPDAWKRQAGKPIERGLASWYGPGFAGRLTANGEIFDPGELTAAHKSLPFNTWVRVVNQDNGQEVVVRINDRGPFIRKRIIDLSRAGAEAVGMVGPGVARVRLYKLEMPPPVSRARVLAEDGETLRGRRFTVQVGAFRESWRAHVLRGEIAGHFPEAEITSDAVWHRVQIGAFRHREAAEEVMRQLVAEGYPAVVLALGGPPLTPESRESP